MKQIAARSPAYHCQVMGDLCAAARLSHPNNPQTLLELNVPLSERASVPPRERSLQRQSRLSFPFTEQPRTSAGERRPCGRVFPTPVTFDIL